MGFWGFLGRFGRRQRGAAQNYAAQAQGGTAQNYAVQVQRGTAQNYAVQVQGGTAVHYNTVQQYSITRHGTGTCALYSKLVAGVVGRYHVIHLIKFLRIFWVGHVG